MAGGGIRGGQVYGSSDKMGGEPLDNPVHVTDFVATIYHALGYGPSTVVHDMGGRPRPIVEGKPVKALLG
jgi:arylsulfatase A-like enzyme